MFYAPRLIEYEQPNGSTRTIGDIEFAQSPVPKILLGEPGAGKSETARAICRELNGEYILADKLLTPSGQDTLEKLNDELLVIDGLDEVLSGSEQIPLVSILRRLHAKGVKDFIVTCRAADWADFQNQRAIENYTNARPRVGHLHPLSSGDIITIVENKLGKTRATTFVAQAESNGVIDWARNPQLLELLIGAVDQEGWPKTKLDLYQLACESFAAEQNQMHRSQNADRPSIDNLLDAAGLACSQLLLSGTRGLNVDGHGDRVFVRITELASEPLKVEHLRSCISTSLFRPTLPDCVEPCHRTVAEYLAGRWLAGALTETLSYRRLIALTQSYDAIPGPLRGLHAWLATFSQKHRRKLIAHDPYGCMRYGDVSQYPLDDLRELLRCLTNLSDRDPYFRNEDWSVDLGNALAAPELKDDILSLLNNPTTPYQLATLILESIHRSELALEITSELTALVLNENKYYAERGRALEVLLEYEDACDWVKLANDLSKPGAGDSSRLATDILEKKVSAFTGAQAAVICKNYIAPGDDESQRVYLGLDRKILSKLDEYQLFELLDELSSNPPENRYERSTFEREIENQITHAVQFALEKTANVDADRIWGWLKYLGRHQQFGGSWNRFTTEYFSTQTDLKRQIQQRAMNETTNDGRLAHVIWSLSDITPGLAFDESDFCFHLERLILQNKRDERFYEEWKNLADCAARHTYFEGDALNLAKEQSRADERLFAIYHEITNRPPPKWEIEQRYFRQKQEAKTERQRQQRHNSYSEIADQIKNGEHLGALNQISMTYLGYVSSPSEDAAPLERIRELVGNDSYDAAVTGLKNSVFRNDIPTPRECITLRVKESKEYFLERVCLVGLAIHAVEGKRLSDLPRNALLCALAACRWGLFGSDNQEISYIEAQLMEELIAEPEGLREFIEDTTEVELLAGVLHPSGLYQITRQDQYQSVVSELSIKWLENSDVISDTSLEEILRAAIRWADRTALSRIVEQRLNETSSDDGGDNARNLWSGAAFAIDFDRFEKRIASFANNNPNAMWPLLKFTSNSEEVKGSGLSVIQISFLLEKFGNTYPMVPAPASGWTQESSYNGGQQIASLITQLGQFEAPEANQILERLLHSLKDPGHLDHAKHVLAEHSRKIAEIAWQTRSLEDVRDILCSKEARSIDDIQATVMDALHDIQEKIGNGTFNGKLPFWNSKQPHQENYCRDRIAEHLEPYLNQHGIRVHTEGTMPDGNRCDLLCTKGETDLPVEIKGQWHSDLWKAASDQLEDNYSRNYRSDGRGIYLVIWFGNVPGKNTPEQKKRGKPDDANHLLTMLPNEATRKISPMTKLFVLDVSK